MIEYVPVTPVFPTTPKLSGVKQEPSFYCYLLRFWSLTGFEMDCSLFGSLMWWQSDAGCGHCTSAYAAVRLDFLAA